ncbi:GntR family transcriptional regulator [Sphaerisporangium melleum]|uniref:GntR family transcriptional regulator n=1 Tax=Sphaerisporangium melleum TaxID=321316 RepID=A0A917VG96_9ACTN|nr:TetR/AcrR family transcriptional regulator C-terminal domain-containing protein [Sphaerisporangium melleum]GGK72172.1 GntR family transcriptional regulator [Sphaerisporangium melleum]GII68368.1 GntR family transcriptional regulator [Sphaerisporangium melleum]
MRETDEPPYLRIVADIRRRITEGGLAPGDRVPSTRQIAGRYGVALATATKAMATLRQQGLVQALPRVGTVVAPAAPGAARAAPPAQEIGPVAGSPAGGSRPSGRPPRPSPGRGTEEDQTEAGRPERELTRERVVRAAIEIADAEGLDGLSMRAVAARLGVATMSSYRHVGGKDDLVLLMADTVFGEYAPPPAPPSGWRDALAGGARALWAVHRRHPWLAQIAPLTRPLPLPNQLPYGERILSALQGRGLGPELTLDIQVLLYNHVQGLAVHLEREAQAQAATGLSGEEWMDRQSAALGSMAADGRHPAFAGLMAALAETGYDLDLDRLFERGLSVLLDGLAAVVEGPAADRP